MGLAERLRDFMGYEQDEEYEPWEDEPQRAAPGPRIELVSLRGADDARRAADLLAEGSGVLFSIARTPRETARRLVDFLGGAIYAKDGQIERVARDTFLVLPFDAEFVTPEL